MHFHSSTSNWHNPAHLNPQAPHQNSSSDPDLDNQIATSHATETAECRNLWAQVRLLQARLAACSATSTDLQDAQERISILERRVRKQDYKHLKNKRIDITSDQAEDEFTELIHGVANWLTDLTTCVDEGWILNSNKDLGQPAALFLSYVTEPCRIAFQIPGFQVISPVIILSTVMNFLCRNIFWKPFYCELGDGVLEFVHGLGRTMLRHGGI